MLKKIVISGAVAMAVATLVAGHDAFSYVTTSWNRFTCSLRGMVPTDFELERARGEIERLKPEVQRSLHLIAREQIEIERLAEQVTELEKRQTGERASLDRLANDLKTGETRFVYAGREFTDGEVREDLANRFERFKTNEQTLASLKKMLNTRRNGLEETRDKVEEMLAMKTQLAAEVVNLEARQKMIDVAKTSSKYVFDDSQLARTNKLIDEIRTRIEVDERMLTAETDILAAIPVEQADHEDIVAEVTEYLDSGTPSQPRADTSIVNVSH